MIKVLASNNYNGYARWIPDCKIVTDIKEADLLLLTGGEDINPALYGEKIGRYTYFSERRDALEVGLYKAAVENHIPVWGTCRGIQLITAMNGGKLVQDMSHHGGHYVRTHDGLVYPTNSLHHQLCNPYGLPKEDYKLLSWCEGISDHYWDGDNKDIYYTTEGELLRAREPESIYFPKTRSIGVQYHPEMMDLRSEAVQYNINLLYKILQHETIDA